MNVSVIIPAYNAADTLGETLESLIKQTYRNWEAIIVDNGSTDGTGVIAAHFAKKDTRIRVVSEPQKGVSIARNTGIKTARFDWLLFLDADDWLLPQHLEKKTSVLISDPNLDAVHCGWARVAPDGKRFFEKFWNESGNLFPAFAYTCAFCIHACIVRRSIIESLGGFDTSLVTCEDWYLWQRIARTGARFGAINEVLSLYRMRQASASNNGFQLFTDALRVIERGHSTDARVPNPAKENVAGMPVTQLSGRKLYLACWTAGLALGRGEDALPMLNVLNGVHDPGLDPEGVAHCLFEAVLLPICSPPSSWNKVWPSIGQNIENFLVALEEKSMAFGLARRASMALKRLILEHSDISQPLTVGTIYTVRIEVTEPIRDIIPPNQVERLHCNIAMEGKHIGIIELPVCDGIVPAYVLADAIAANFSWHIIGKFFERTVYPNLNTKREPNGFSIWRGRQRLAEISDGDEQIVKQQIHEHVGWTIFLQEIWGSYNLSLIDFYYIPKKLPSKKVDWKNISSMNINWGILQQNVWKIYFKFYEYFFKRKRVRQRILNSDWITIEVSEEICDIITTCRNINVVLTVGGVTIGTVVIPVKQNSVYEKELRVALTKASGYELCRAAVREGLLGKPLAGKSFSLRDRLNAAKVSLLQCGEEPSFSKEHPEFKFTPETDRILNYISYPKDACIILGRRLHKEIGTSVSRRAMLPPSVSYELINAAQVAEEPVIIILSQDEQPKHTIYMPEMICHPLQEKQPYTAEANDSAITQDDSLVSGSHDYFDNIFAEKEDPWNYTSPYEQKKYEQTLAMLPSHRVGRALELACAEGHFTIQLAPHVDSLIAADISHIAVDRTAKHCMGMKNILFQQLNLVHDPLPGIFELIVCSEVLYCIGEYDTLKNVAHKLVEALQPGGYLLMAHAQVIADDPEHTGFDWGLPFGVKTISEMFTGIDSLRLVKEIRTPLYRIQLFQKRSRMLRLFCHSTPEILNLKYQPTPIEPEVASYVRWRSGGHPQSSIAENAVTNRLPILMYHRVAPTGASSTVRYRVTPEQFEEQLHYLQNEGYYSVNLEDWHYTMERKMPLPGKAVVLTFDDGYLDFKTYAWPLLRKYGFLATVFLVTDNIGELNSWDSVYGEELPLLGWKDIRKLQDEGVEFGSHTASHPYLTSLSSAEIVREGARSRATLVQELGRVVKSFAYPYGDVDGVVQHLIGACGYTFGLSCRQDLCSFHDNLLVLPRIEVMGSYSLQDLIEKLRVQ